MKNTLLVVVLFSLTPAVGLGQSDLQKVLRGIQQFQDMQKRLDQENRRNSPPPSRPQPYQDPNRSGNQNRGEFRDPRQLFPSPGSQNRPQQSQYPQQGRIQPTPQSRRTYSNLPIVIHCDPDAAVPCRYSLVTLTNRSFPYQIKPGQIQQLKENTDWNFSYQPTGTGPWRTYRLRGGKHYEVRRQGNRWQLFMLE